MATNPRTKEGPLSWWRWPSLQALALLIIAILGGLLLGPSWVSELTVVGLYALTVIGMNLFMGYAGQVSLGQAGFFGIGAYSVGIITTQYQFSPWLGLLAGMLIAGVVAWLLGKLVLKLQTHYLALATLAFGMIANVAFQALSITGGNSGLTGIGNFSLGVSFSNTDYYWFVWILVALAAWYATRMVHSESGSLLEAVRSSEVATKLMGLNPDQVKREMFVVSAILAALAGGVYASWIGYIDPTVFTFTLSINLVLMAVVGGMRSVYGAVVGVGVVQLLGQGLNTVGQMISPAAGGALELTVYGLILVVVMMFWPNGLITAWKGRYRQSSVVSPPSAVSD
ncbi:MAG: branched-chain amino acid ABC transporter permease [Sulfobacillus benefaciens]|uniref:Branched-chain amino acid ABC transporter permease n=1 Tax=Sulfobacillus benefaciens TaxID=453960 RepID=A0A2T2XGH3_9FIRM|nr:MAG: branched-chain amino acid ABC transporter permease [Sulfobacillus benefaciens]